MKQTIALALVLVILLGALPPGIAANTPDLREITDMAGRTMMVPVQIDSVFSTEPVAAIYLYTTAPEKLLGWNYQLSDEEKQWILPPYGDLPNYGVKSTVNYEAVIMANPSIALSVGKINKAMIDEADHLADTLGIPVVCMDEDLNAIADSYRFLGMLLGEETRAEQLASYAEQTLDELAAIDVPHDQRVRLYYGNGEDSLETAPAGSSHSQFIEMVGAVNAAELELGDGHRMQISPEQLLAWNPEVVLLSGEVKTGLSSTAAAELLKNNPVFSLLTAVEEDKVLAAPGVPFGWLDRPPGPNRLIGLRWLAGWIYPDFFERDVDETVAEFFRLFYHMELTAEQLASLLGNRE